MNTENAVMNVDSIEELTLHSLDRSLEGLEQLRRDSLRCGNMLLENPPEGLSLLSGLASNLHTFYVFEGDVCSLFQIDGERMRDHKGNLKSVETRFNAVLNDMTAKLSANDLSGLADLLRIDLPQLMDRFQDLLPRLKDYIYDEYLHPSN